MIDGFIGTSLFGEGEYVSYPLPAITTRELGYTPAVRAHDTVCSRRCEVLHWLWEGGKEPFRFAVVGSYSAGG